MARTVSKIKQGKLITNNVILEKHEMVTVNFLLAQGFDIELIKPSLTPGSKNADLIMSGLIWEMKCPNGDNKTTIDRILHKAAKQSENIILDLRSMRSNNDFMINQAAKRLALSKRIKRILVITRQNQLIDL